MKKIAIITGASGAIGYATAKELQKENYFVILFYHKNKEPALSLMNELNQNDFCASSYCVDVSCYTQVQDAVTDVIKTFGKVDLLVNNAGIAQQKLFTDITVSDWQTMFEVNVNSVFYMCKCVLPSMIQQKSGKIINISSIWGICGASCETHYSASKAAIIGLTKALAQEVGPSNIYVNCVAPGVIDTKMNDNLSEADLEDLKNQTPLMKIGTPQDVANIICFLASEKSNFITGQVISPNGGIL